MRDYSRRSISWPACAAAVWALVFAVFHLLWATGLYVGLNHEQARMAFSKRGFLVYDLVVAAACLFAVPVALALAMPRARRLPRRLVGILAWTGTGLLMLRSGASLIQAAYLIATQRFDIKTMGIWEPWFYLGATLFGVSTWRYWRARASGPA